MVSYKSKEIVFDLAWIVFNEKYNAYELSGGYRELVPIVSVDPEDKIIIKGRLINVVEDDAFIELRCVAKDVQFFGIQFYRSIINKEDKVDTRVRLYVKKDKAKMKIDKGKEKIEKTV